MDDRKLLVRMSVVSAILFAFYLGLVRLGLAVGLGLPTVVGGLVAFVAVQYYVGTRGVLRQVDAVDLPREEFRALHEEYERASEEMGFDEAPRLMVAHMGVPNAFAVGRKGNGTVVVSAELLALLDFDEAAAVLGHELAHLKNRDSVVMVIGESLSTVVGLVVMLAFSVSDHVLLDLVAFVLGVVAKLVVSLFVLALSRYREYAADRDAADAMGTGDPLSRALERIEASSSGGGATVEANVSALCITAVDDGLLASLFRTHPPVEKRVEQLRSRQ